MIARTPGELLAIRRPGGHGRNPADVRHLLDSGAVRVHDVEVVVAIAVTLERDLLAVRRPDAAEVVSTVVSQLPDPRPVGVHDVDFAATEVGWEAVERDQFTVG